MNSGWLLASACYCVFTLSDGALRMLVLLHLHEQGRTPSALALVLLPYELAGVFTNLLGGYLGARFGLKVTLLAGLLLQVVACAMLAADAVWLTLGYVMTTQVLSGVAKDFAKTAAKSYAGALAPANGDAGRFRLVAAVTGSKNAMKGLGFFAGGALLAACGFRATNGALALLLAVAAGLAWWCLPVRTGRRTAAIVDVLRPERSLRWLALARAFLFGSRDVWFAVALPLFLATACGWPAPAVGAFLAAWVIGYGAVQAATPRWFPLANPAGAARSIVISTAALVVPLLATAAALHFGLAPAPTIVLGLCAYGVVFAATSSLHSGLVVVLAGSERTAERVGFYYAANSAGRLAGTLASGALFQAAASPLEGLVHCLLVAAGSALGSCVCTVPLRARS
jgi:MFS family permease